MLQAPAAVAYKLWPLAHWRALVAALLERGLQVVLTGAPSAGDKALVESVRERLRRATASLDVAGRLDLNQVATLLRGAALYVGGDTSITHLAAACEIPVVALYGPINPRYFGPWPPSPTLAVPYVAPRAGAARRQRQRAAGNAGVRALRPRRLRGPQRQRERLPADDGAGARRRRGRPDPGFGPRR